MNICMVSAHCCIRVFKQATALKEKGHSVHSMAGEQSTGWNAFDSYSLFMDADACKRMVEFYDKKVGVDVFHVHNEPDHMVSWVREATAKPVVYDCHDLQSLRTMSKPDKWECLAFSLSDAVVHVSEPIAEKAKEVHGDKKSAVVYSYVNERFIRPEEAIADRCKNTMVYQGGVGNAGFMFQGAVNYRYYVPMVASFYNQGYKVFIFPAGHGFDASEYINAGAICSGPHLYPVMLRHLSIHGMGFVGACCNAPIMQAAMPNKLFEYISQGVVPVVMFCDEAGKFVKEHDCGVVLDGTFSKLSAQLGDIEAKRKNVMAIRHEFTMEKEVEKLEALYREVA